MTDYTTKHYQFKHTILITPEDVKKGYVELRLDPYFVSKAWKLGSKDESGALFHQLKTISRFGEKNSVPREINALFNQAIGMARTYGVTLNVHDWSFIEKNKEETESNSVNPSIDMFKQSQKEIVKLILDFRKNPNLDKFNNLLDSILDKIVFAD